MTLCVNCVFIFFVVVKVGVVVVGRLFVIYSMCLLMLH